ncbi:unnamed protein product [Lota lota]
MLSFRSWHLFSLHFSTPVRVRWLVPWPSLCLPAPGINTCSRKAAQSGSALPSAADKHFDEPPLPRQLDGNTYIEAGTRLETGLYWSAVVNAGDSERRLEVISLTAGTGRGLATRKMKQPRGASRKPLQTCQLHHDIRMKRVEDTGGGKPFVFGVSRRAVTASRHR